MKKISNFIITVTLTVVLSLIILSVFSNIFIPKWIDHENNMMSFIIKGFYREPKNSLDILFMGNSDVYRGVSPMKLYEETGITSYNFVSSGQRMWISKPMLEDALKRQSPKIIFFNVDSLFYTHAASSGNYHKVYDNMPFGFPKINGVFDSNYPASISEKITHFLPILAYHSRYTELTETDFKYAFYNYTSHTKGMDLVATIEPYNEGNYYMSNNDKSPVSIPKENEKYLNEMLEICKKNNVELILFELPSAESWSNEKSIAVNKYADKLNIKFLDLNLDSEIEKMGFDWEKDTSDGGDHLNIFGAEKVSKYIANYLIENYGFESHKDEIEYECWNESYKKYLKIKEAEIDYEIQN